MAVGNAVGGRLADRTVRTPRLYGWLEIVIVATVLITPITFRLLHEVYRGAFDSLETTPSSCLARMRRSRSTKPVSAVSWRDRGSSTTSPPRSTPLPDRRMSGSG
jgi:hypothetical protein